jgi:hypothetical protein
MKKIILLILLLPFLMAQQIVYYDNVPIAWDAVSSVAGSTITYEILRASVGDPGVAEIVTEISAAEYSVPLILEGDWIVGVRTVRTVDANGERLLSEINWSDINGLNTPTPFIVRHFTAPGMPTNLRLQ